MLFDVIIYSNIIAILNFKKLKQRGRRRMEEKAELKEEGAGREALREDEGGRDGL